MDVLSEMAINAKCFLRRDTRCGECGYWSHCGILTTLSDTVKDLEAARKAIREAVKELEEEIRISNDEGGIGMNVVVAFRLLKCALKNESEGGSDD